MQIRWMHLFLDTPQADAATSWAYWAEVTGSTLSPVRGEHGQFATLLPAHGDAWLKVQAVDEGPGGVHLDIDTDDRAGLVAMALELGATVQATYHDVVVLRSPAGIVFCATVGDGGAVDRHAQWTPGARFRPDGLTQQPFPGSARRKTAGRDPSAHR